MDPLRRDDVERGGVSPPRKAWSIHEASPLLLGGRNSERQNNNNDNKRTLVRRNSSNGGRSRGNVILYVIYALVNVIIAVPGLYGTSKRHVTRVFTWRVDEHQARLYSHYFLRRCDSTQVMLR